MVQWLNNERPSARSLKVLSSATVPQCRWQSSSSFSFSPSSWPLWPTFGSKTIGSSTRIEDGRTKIGIGHQSDTTWIQLIKKNFSGWVSFFTLAPLFLLENSHETQERWCTTSVGVCLCKRGVREKEREREIERLGKPLKVEKARPASSSVLHSQKEGQRLERLPIKKRKRPRLD